MLTGSKMNCATTVNEIFRAYSNSYLQTYPKASLQERKVLRSIEICRTEALGGRIEECDYCGYKIILYNSCRNRHCPQCQSMKKEKWILERKNEVLPFTYFHIVFALPDTLNPLQNRRRRSQNRHNISKQDNLADTERHGRTFRSKCSSYIQAFEKHF